MMKNNMIDEYMIFLYIVVVVTSVAQLWKLFC